MTTPQEEDWQYTVIIGDGISSLLLCPRYMWHIVTNAAANTVPLFCDYKKALCVVFFTLVNVNDKFISLDIKLGMVEFLPIKKKSEMKMEPYHMFQIYMILK
jgi:hypothetical protein